MSAPCFLRLALPTPMRRLFDYLPLQGVDSRTLIPGIRYSVPFQSRTLVGFLVAVVTETAVPAAKLKAVHEQLDTAPLLPADLYQLCMWAADYYHYSLGEVLASALPKALRKGQSCALQSSATPNLTTTSLAQTPLTLNPEQDNALQHINSTHEIFKVCLLEGVTGSGKTEVYLQALQHILQTGKQALILVPEISLTPQTVARFQDRFAVPVVALHSSLSEKTRLNGWLAARSGEARIVIGTRSAIFTPFAALGLIIVDEEHDTSFKQQDRFRYHARDVAIMRARLLQIPIVLGTATPSLETLLNVKRQRYDYLSLPHRAGVATLPHYQLINMHQEIVSEGLSQTLLKTMATHLALGNQVLLFLNRRGFAPVLYCSHCTAIVGCRHCAARMVYHRNPKRLQCHHCDARSNLPTQCEQCGKATLQALGIGTERLEEMLAEHFATIPIIRVDRDSTAKKSALQQLLQKIHSEKTAILLGTQMLAKGHHFPQVTLVGVVDTDSGFFSTDFRAAEQMGQLLIQVAGRAGREEKAGTVLIQTRHPTHPHLQRLLQQGYGHFAETLLSERQQINLPPYTYFAVFRAEARNADNAIHFLNTIKKMHDHSATSLNLLGPVPAILAKRKGYYCQHLLVKANERKTLQQFLKQALAKIEQSKLNRSVRWIVDIDPVEV